MIRTAIESDIHRIGDDMRESDAIEVRRSHGHTPHEAVSHSFWMSSTCLSVVLKGRPVAMFGLCPDQNAVCRQATIWLLGTNGLKDMQITFLKLSREFIEWMLDQTPYLFNFVDADNHTTQRWLEWCGAKLEEPKPYGKEGRLFRQFVIERKPAYV